MASSDCESLIAEILSPDRFLHQDAFILFRCCGHRSVWMTLLCLAANRSSTKLPMFRVFGTRSRTSPGWDFTSITGPEPMRWASFRMSSDETLRITQVCMLPLRPSCHGTSGDVDPQPVYHQSGW